MPVIKLTKRTVDALMPSDRSYIAYDESLKGFGVKVTSSGAKSWIVEYRPGAGGRRASKRRMTLGKTTSITPDQARRIAGDTLAAVRLGSDPAQ